MFALDTLVRSAVHACIAIVLPDIDIDPYPQTFIKTSRTKPSTIDSNNTKHSNSSHGQGVLIVIVMMCAEFRLE